VSRVRKLAEEIKDKGLQGVSELPRLLVEAEAICSDETQDVLTRALAHRAAANAEYLLNSFDRALGHYDQAVRMLERGDDLDELGRTLHAKVGMLYLLSRFDELFECSVRARRIFEQLGDRGRLARLDVNLAHAYHRLDRHAEALACCERALPVLDEVGDQEGLLAALINTAVVVTIQHDFDRAIGLYRRALALAESQGKTSWVLLARYNLAYMNYLQGEAGDALRLFDQLRQEYDQAGNDRYASLCRLDEAEILLEIGDTDESILCAREARQLAKKLGLNFEIGKSLLFEGCALQRAGKPDEATPLLQEARQRFESETNNVWTAMLRLQTVMVGGTRMGPGILDEAAEAQQILYKSGLPHLQAFADVIVGQLQAAAGNASASVQSFQRAVRHADNGKSAWMQFHGYYNLGVALSSQNAAAGIAMLYRAEAMLDSLWHKLGSDNLKLAFLADRESVYTRLVAHTVADQPDHAFRLSEKSRSRVLREAIINEGLDLSLEPIQRRLLPHETVLEYFVTGDDLLVFAANRDSMRSVRLGSVSELTEECLHFDRHLASCSVKWERLAPVHRHLEMTALNHLEKMYRSLVAPVESELRSSLIVVPHGFLHGVPFHAFFDGSAYLSERHQVTYSPSASVYCVAPQRLDCRPAVFVAFSRQAETSSIEEIEAVAQAFARSEVLVNPSVARLREAFEHPRELVHIAGHAGIDTVGGRLSWFETPEGRLTSRDLQDMQIRARTVVVTGCQSARRHIYPGDEWLGLMRAFYLSGASAIVSAFWDVRAESAQAFAKTFYSQFDGTNAAQCVRQASSAIRDRQCHPYFWAGFGSFVRRSPQDVRFTN
jgi:tetratricopeptide (TPR) repeat protein